MNRVPEPDLALDPRARSLAELEARARYELACLAYPEEPWLPRVRDGRGREVLDVLVVGAGQGGLALAFALARERVSNVLLVDRAPEGREGPWTTFARMRELRTPKYLTGPDCGIPSLTFRAWYEAEGRQPPWDALGRIPRLVWMGYLSWLRRLLDPPVRNRVTVLGIGPTADGFLEVRAAGEDGLLALVTRKLVLANGMDGGGAWAAPTALTAPLPRAVWAHSSDAIDFRRLAGRRVLILGIGAAALDNAGAALDHGAASVEVHFRKPAVPRIEVREWLENVGFLRAFGDLDDAGRWRVMRRVLGSGAPPPAWSLERVASDPRFGLQPGRSWLATRWNGRRIEVETTEGPAEADFVVLATGARIDLSLRPEIAAHAGRIARWRDRFTPPGEADEAMADYPYLGRGFELQERVRGEAPWLADVHLFNWAATASLGVSASSITGMKFGVARLVTALVRDLYRTVADRHASAIPWPESEAFAPE